MKKVYLALLSILVVLSLMSCSVSQPETATVRFTLPRSGARTITPTETDLDITSYVFQFTSLTDASYSFSKTHYRNSSESYKIEGVKPGKYTVTVSGKNADGTTLAESTGEYRFLPGLNNYSITLTSLYGSGSMALTFRWSPELFRDRNDNIITPSFSISLVTQSGSTIAIADSEKTVDAEHGTLVISKTSLPSGSYVITLQLKNGAAIVSGIVQAIRISNGAATTGTIDFEMGKSSEISGFAVVDNTSSPIEATITPSRTYSPGDAYTGANVTFSLDFTKLPAGITEDDISVEWYMEDYNTGHLKTLTTLPFGGTSTCTAVYSCPRVGSVGSTTISYYYPEY